MIIKVISVSDETETFVLRVIEVGQPSGRAFVADCGVSEWGALLPSTFSGGKLDRRIFAAIVFLDPRTYDLILAVAGFG